MVEQEKMELIAESVREAEEHVARQHEIIKVLRTGQQNTEAAENVLARFEAKLAELVAHLDRLKSN